MNNFEAANLVKAFADMRKMYNDLVEISKNKRYPEEQRYEAKALTDGGFYLFLAKVMSFQNKEVKTFLKNDNEPELY